MTSERKTEGRLGMLLRDFSGKVDKEMDRQGDRCRSRRFHLPYESESIILARAEVGSQ